MFLVVFLWENKHRVEAPFLKLSAVRRKSAEQVTCTAEGVFALVAVPTLETVCSWNSFVIMVWAWAQWQSYAFGTRMLSMLLQHER